MSSLDSDSPSNIILLDHKAEKTKEETIYPSVHLKPSEFVLEFVGNFFIVTSIYYANGSAIATPAMVACLITVIGPVTGAHFNVAITALVPLIERLHNYPRSTLKRALGYFTAQVLGTLSANLLACLFMGWGKLVKIAPAKDLSLYNAVSIEFCITFMLMLYACACSHPHAQRESFLNGIAFFVLIFMFGSTTGQYCGALLNPTIAITNGMLNMIVHGDIDNLLVMLLYILIEFLAVPLGFLTYKIFLSDAMFPRGEIPSLKDEDGSHKATVLLAKKKQNTKEVSSDTSL